MSRSHNNEAPGSRDGALIVNKPPGPTSHDVVQSVRRLYQTKVGHTGTLDPLASGVLVLLLGKATRLSRFLQAADKKYRAVVRLGISTDTHDREGRIVCSREVPKLDRRKVESVLASLRGSLEQVPPMFSAVQVGGERLYKKARRGETVERPPRVVSIYDLELEHWDTEHLTFLVECSSGTYVRVLAHEIGDRLSCGGHLSALCRLQVGPFTISNAVDLRGLDAHSNPGVIPMQDLLPHLERIDLDPLQGRLASNGNSIKMSVPPGYYRLFLDGCLIAIAEQAADEVQPRVVLT